MKKHVSDNKYKYITIVLVIAIILFFTLRGGKEEDLGPTFTIEKTTLTKEVLVTGSVKSSESVDLGFEKGGAISRINVEVGDRVSVGTLIAVLENKSELANLEEAKAALSLEESAYEEIVKGAREEQIKVSEASLEKEKSTLTSYYDSVSELLDNAYNKAENAVNKQTDPIFTNDFTASPELTFITTNPQDTINSEDGRLGVQQVIKNLKSISETNWKGEVEKESALLQTRTYLFSVQDFLNAVNGALNTASGISDTTLATYKSNIDTARTNVNTAISSINTLLKNIETQRSVITKYEKDLALAKAPATKEELAKAEARVAQAKAKVKSLEADLERTYLYSPINGVVTSEETGRGEIVSAGAKLVSIINTGTLQIEANVPEADIAEIEKGATAEVTLDAYGNKDTFLAKVNMIDPAEKVIEGVPTYKTTLFFEDKDDRIKSGMTANVSIITEKREDVVAIPARAIINDEDKSYVDVLKEDGQSERREITTGIRGSDGNVEVIEGLLEGEKILLDVNN